MWTLEGDGFPFPWSTASPNPMRVQKNIPLQITHLLPPSGKRINRSSKKTGKRTVDLVINLPLWFFLKDSTPNLPNNLVKDCQSVSMLLTALTFGRGCSRGHQYLGSHLANEAFLESLLDNKCTIWYRFLSQTNVYKSNVKFKIFWISICYKFRLKWRNFCIFCH